MKDPESGQGPSDSGALAKGAEVGDHPSRRLRHKKMGSLPSSPAQIASLPAISGEIKRPEPAASEGTLRKRKRRRRGRGQKSGLVTAQNQKAEPSLQPADGAPHRSGKSRNRRGPQGRPLANTAPKASSKEPVLVSSDPAFHPQPEITMPVGERLTSGFTHYPADNLYAALDLGTNNCRLLIAQPTRPGQFRVIDAFSRIVRLGEGLDATGKLSMEAMDRAVDALKICAIKLKQRDIRRMRLIATEACRAATNGEEFLARVLRETGLELEIISRQTEAQLAVSGCASLIGHEARSVVLFDIGGGSSEIAVLQIGEQRRGRLANHITHWTSLPVGVVTLSERHGGRNVTPDIFTRMADEVGAMLDRFESPPLATLKRHPPAMDGTSSFHLIGTSGTVTTLAGVYLNLPRYDRRQVDGLWLADGDVTTMQAKLLALDFDGRAANPCIGPDRADLVLAGCAILEAIRRRWPCDRMRVADRGLREGLLTDMMADDSAWQANRTGTTPMPPAPIHPAPIHPASRSHP